jgi:glycosyltransferase involved in cell wall biosynthesis
MAKKNIRITVALAAYNEAANIRRCLDSVQSLADEIVVVDGNSTDNTAAIAKACGATVIATNNRQMFHINKQKALDNAHGTWVLQLDADEVVDSALAEEIRAVCGDPRSLDGYAIPRRNYFLGDWLRKGGQYPDYVIRLFRREKGSFPQKSVHEQIAITGSVGKLSHALDHYSYVSIAQYWKKSAAYIALTAQELAHTKNNRSPVKAVRYLIGKPVATFFLLFIRHKGFVDGWRGLLFALFSALHFPKAYLLSLAS